MKVYCIPLYHFLMVCVNLISLSYHIFSAYEPLCASFSLSP